MGALAERTYVHMRGSEERRTDNTQECNSGFCEHTETHGKGDFHLYHTCRIFRMDNTREKKKELKKVINRMQENGDKVERDILGIEELLTIDTENEKMKLPYKHQIEIANCLSEVEELLKNLFLDLDKPRTLNHPQAKEIEEDVRRLHDRWQRDCSVYRDLYKPISMMGLQPNINWAQVFSQKQKEVNSKAYGPTIADLEKQIAAHNILHIEIKAYNDKLSPESTNLKEEYAAIKNQYCNLLDISKLRCHHLNSLYEFMQGCNKEVSYFSEEKAKILQQDWSDRMVDAPDVRRRYENFRDVHLLSRENKVNKLRDDGDHLLELNHPATDIIQAQKQALINEWETFLNLCICQETHLDKVDEYKKYQLDIGTLSVSLSSLKSTLDLKTLANKTTTEIGLQLEAEERSLQRSEQLLADLRKRSTTITPLKLRYTTPSPPTTVESLCEWSTPKASLLRGERFTLKSTTNNAGWEVQSSNGTTSSFPGVCFLILPPDPEATGKVAWLGKELEKLKESLLVVRDSLKSQTAEPIQMQKAGAKFVDKYRTELIERVCSVMEIVDCLQSKNMITAEMYSTIQSTKPSQEQMRLLYRVLESGGAAVKVEFYTILKNKQYYLVKDLEAGSMRA